MCVALCGLVWPYCKVAAFLQGRETRFREVTQVSAPRLFVGGLAQQADDAVVREYFAQFGPVRALLQLSCSSLVFPFLEAENQGSSTGDVNVFAESLPSSWKRRSISITSPATPRASHS